MAVHGGDHRLVVLVDGGIHAPAAILEPGEFLLGLLGVFDDVGTGHEAPALARDDDGVDVGRLVQFGEGGGDLALHDQIDGVELLRAPERDQADGTRSLDRQRGVGHAAAS